MVRASVPALLAETVTRKKCSTPARSQEAAARMTVEAESLRDHICTSSSTELNGRTTTSLPSAASRRRGIVSSVRRTPFVLRKVAKPRFAACEKSSVQSSLRSVSPPEKATAAPGRAEASSSRPRALSSLVVV